MLKCGKCQEEKSENRFYFNKKRQKYQTSWCYDCKNKKRNEQYVSRKAEKNLICKQCNQERDGSRFFFNKRNNQYQTSKCYDCRNKHRNERRKHDVSFKQKENLRYEKWAQGKDRSEYNREWAKNNREHINAKRKERQRTNIHSYLRESIRSRIADCLRNYVKRKYKKTQASFQYLGCDIETYVAWLEFNFHDGMNWDNRGVFWHIDHVKPCASFDFTREEELKCCFYWTNTFPLTKEKNISKSDKIDTKYIEHVKKRVNDFLNTHKTKVPSDLIETQNCEKP